MPKFTLLETRAYYDALFHAVKDAQRSINITSYDLIYDHKTKTLLDAIIAAARKGITVTISADTMSFNEVRKKALGPISLNHPSGEALRDYKEKLERAGGRVEWLSNTKVLNPYKQRNHEKWSVIDDHCFTFGGVNMYDAGFANNDYMLHTKNAKLADFLRGEHYKIITNAAEYRGAHHIIDDESECYIDSAETYSSVIYKKACTLARQAESAVYVSQYYPTGKLGILLKRISTQYYINRPENMRGLAKLMLLFDRWRCHIKNSYQKDRYLHAKFILFTMKDGSKVALTGSHNFSYAGVRYGTIEIDMQTSNLHTIRQLESFVEKIAS
jgi:cardiolipin synthase